MAGGLLAGFAGPVMSGCTTNPATGRSQLALMSMDQQIALGTEAAPELTAEYGGEVRDEQLRAYVRDIGERMAATTEANYPSLPWTFTLLDSDVLNAFALPGGKVFISRGLAQRMTNEAQLASVIGHEIGHVTAEHVPERITRGMVAQGLIAGTAAAAGLSDSDLVRAGVPLLIGVGGQGYLLRFGREQELEADALGVRYMVNVGYDPLGARQIQEILGAASGGAAQLEILSTHPLSETRVRRIDEMLRNEFAHTQNNPQFSLHRERYQSQFLNRMAELPPARHRGVARFAHAHDAPQHEAQHDQIDWDNPVTWCGVCAGLAAAD
ncbi:MAG: M48 family peptidase [Phycisphaerales bacterium]|nr:MAG: M48 family peptidase [Phycisphaerales bacterium]